MTDQDRGRWGMIRLMIKGDLAAAETALAAHAISPIGAIEAHIPEDQYRYCVCHAANADCTKAIKWLNEAGGPPYPPGTLLLITQPDEYGIGESGAGVAWDELGKVIGANATRG